MSDAVVLAPRSSDLAGHRMVHRELGSGAPLVLIHGYPTSSLLWRRVMPLLATGRRVLAPDLPGYGLSDDRGVGAGTVPALAGVLGLWLDAQGIERTDLVLHDLGGPVGMHWALGHGARVGRVVVVNSLLSPRLRWQDQVVLRAMSTPGGRRLLTTPTLMRRLLRMGVRDRRAMPRERADAWLAPFLQPAERPRQGRLFAEAFGAESRAALQGVWGALPGFDRPIGLVISGEDVFCKTYMEQLHARLPQAPLLRLPRTGHLVQEEQPERLAAAILELLG